MHYFSSKDRKLAQKYGLGIPIRKYQFHSPHLFYTNTPSPFVKLAGMWLMSVLGIGLGLYLDILTTIKARVYWMWPWILTGALVPILFGLTAHHMGQKRLARLNCAATIVSFFLVTLYNTLFFTKNLSMHYISSILIGIFLQFIGLTMLRSGYHAIVGLSSVLICTDGCLAIARTDKIHAIHWDGVTTFWEGRNSAKIICDDGTKLTINYQWPNGIAARDLIYGKVFRHIRARALSAYEAGEPVTFGKFTVSQLGINNGTHLFLWERIRECEYRENGVALIGNDNSYLDLVSSRVLPNAVVFVSLVNAIVKSHTAQKMYLSCEV
jgi:hypothetical protein